VVRQGGHPGTPGWGERYAVGVHLVPGVAEYQLEQHVDRLAVEGLVGPAEYTGETETVVDAQFGHGVVLAPDREHKRFFRPFLIRPERHGFSLAGGLVWVNRLVGIQRRARPPAR
jgi:hypothetical protein